MNNIPEWFEQQISCPACDGKVKAAVEPADPTIKPSAWTCPHCQKRHTTDFGGRLHGVARRSEWWITWA